MPPWEVGPKTTTSGILRWRLRKLVRVGIIRSNRPWRRRQKCRHLSFSAASFHSIIFISEIHEEHYCVLAASSARAPLLVSEGPQFLALCYEASALDNIHSKLQDGLEKVNDWQVVQQRTAGNLFNQYVDYFAPSVEDEACLEGYSSDEITDARSVVCV
jgi:hypothetical protein